jgi:hypothetical protein
MIVVGAKEPGHSDGPAVYPSSWMGNWPYGVATLLHFIPGDAW